MSARHAIRRKLTLIVGILTLCLAVVGTAGASGRHHHYRSRHSSVRISTVRQSNRIVQANSNQVNIVAVGGSATATCSPTNGNNTATANGTNGTAIAANVNFCAPTAQGGNAAAVNTGTINQTGTNTATATNTATR
jgi:hypothetical protein